MTRAIKSLIKTMAPILMAAKLSRNALQAAILAIWSTIVVAFPILVDNALLVLLAFSAFFLIP